ncbi:stage II sporulation protein M [Actinomyces lilanjuaniae]
MGAGLPVALASVIGMAVGVISLHGVQSPAGGPVPGDSETSLWEVVYPIAATNLPACLLLYTGVLTCGAGTLLSTFMLTTYIGATLTAAAANVGWLSAIGSIWIYAPLEFTGFALASYGGLLPLATAVTDAEGTGTSVPSWLRRYGDGMSRSLRFLLLSLLVVTVAAVVEAVVIRSRLGN